MTQDDLIVFKWSNTKRGKKPKSWIVKRHMRVSTMTKIVVIIDEVIEQHKVDGTWKNKYTGCLIGDLKRRINRSHNHILETVYIMVALDIINIREHGRAKVLLLTRKGRDILTKIKMEN